MAGYTQAVNLVRNTVQKMNMVQGIALSDIELCDPISSPVCFLSAGFTDTCTSGQNCVFAPEGGGLDINIFKGLDPDTQFREAAAGNTMPGHATNQILLYSEFGTNDSTLCEIFHSGLGLPTVIETETIPGGSVNGDGTSHTDEYDFCYSSVVGSNTFYTATHMLGAYD